jgi:hypothetical protein
MCGKDRVFCKFGRTSIRLTSFWHIAMKIVVITLLLLTFGWLTSSSRFVLRTNSSNTMCELFDGSNAYAHGSWVERSEEKNKKAARSGELFHLYDQQVCPQSKSDISKYDWMPRDCDLVSWDASRFCEKTTNRKILFIGDSTMLQTYSTLTAMINQSHLTHEECFNCTSRMTFRYSDFIVFQGREDNGTHLMAAVREVGFAYDIIVMGTSSSGAYYDGYINRQKFTIDEEGFGNYFLPKLLEDVEYISSVRRINLKVRKPIFIWKTETPPHPGCDRYSEPLKTEELEIQSSKFHWENSFQFDKKIKKITKVTPDLKVFDMSPLHLRPDAHPGNEDCLHYCSPGPLNYFARVFLQALVNNEI